MINEKWSCPQESPDEATSYSFTALAQRRRNEVVASFDRDRYSRGIKAVSTVTGRATGTVLLQVGTGETSVPCGAVTASGGLGTAGDLQGDLRLKPILKRKKGVKNLNDFGVRIHGCYLM